MIKIMINNEIKQLQKEKEYKLRNMDVKEIKRYIERTLAYYYSHYANTNKIYNTKPDERSQHTMDAMEFQESFFNNMDTIIESIKNNKSYSNIERQMKINYILAVLYSSMNDNFMLNYEQDAKQLQEIYDETENKMHTQITISGSLIVLVSFVNKSYDLLLQIQKMLLTLYTLSAGYNIGESEFNIINDCFKSLFLYFYVSYLCSKKSYEQIIAQYKEQDRDVENIIESGVIKSFYTDARDRLKQMDGMFDDIIGSGDLFAYPKSTLENPLLDYGVFYSLKMFDVYNLADNGAGGVCVDDIAMCDEYKMLLDMEKQYDIYVLPDLLDGAGGGL